MDDRRPRGTIYSVAERAGVSISTVSLAVNHPERVGAETRRRVVQAARELGYRPLSKDGVTRGGRTAGIAVVAPFSSYPSYGRRLAGILDRLRETSIDVIVHDVASAAAADQPLLDALPVRAGIDGVVLMGVPLTREAHDALTASAPVVMVDVVDAPGSSVRTDDRGAGTLLGRHLLERGHRNAVFLHEEQRSPAYTSGGMLRVEGLTASLQDGGGRLRTLQIDDLEDPAAYGAALDRVAEDSSVTAVVGNHELIAVGALAASRTRSDQRVAVAGFDDSPLATVLGLTTVRQPFEESGRIAAELMLDLLAGRTGTRRVELTGDLMVRASTQTP
ncbi:LacI family DNA-binding transcriptional regulator [Cellulomonas sp. RIT-PI-Y]|uniref:LacI family DNA-binding transcriptional regulator n=1 Tax=Cellulomonas sp. RIT-PI-Y TaxID=3035297 RepID=UPI0021DAE1EC|nr:LacI family DNA-binding transcriptional regulator [Cellulomonas sp. RIT-PI-Y]